MAAIGSIERRLSAALCVLVVVTAFWVGQARATSYSTDASDIWWNPAESGWGIQLAQ